METGKLNPGALRKILFDCIASVAPEADFEALRTDRPWREELEIDSFDFQNILIAVSKRLGIEVPESDYRKLATLDTFIRYLAERMGAAG
jgi:acyl carrier protein